MREAFLLHLRPGQTCLQSNRPQARSGEDRSWVRYCHHRPIDRASSLAMMKSCLLMPRSTAIRSSQRFCSGVIRKATVALRCLQLRAGYQDAQRPADRAHSRGPGRLRQLHTRYRRERRHDALDVLFTICHSSLQRVTLARWSDEYFRRLTPMK